MTDALGEASPRATLVGRVALSLAVVAAVALVGVTQDGRFLKLATEAAVAAWVAIFCARHAAAALGVLVVFLPLQIIGLAWLYHLGLPAPVVRGLGSVKDVIVLGIVIAAVRARREAGRRFDLADICLLGYIAVASAYLVLPRLLPTELTSLPLHVTSLAWRTDASFAILILALRHLPVREQERARIEHAIILVGLVVAGCGYYEYFDPGGWYSFLSHGPHVPEYLINILKSPATLNDLVRRTAVGSTQQVRAGSLLFEPVDLGFYLLLPLGLLLRGVSARRARLSIPAVAAVAGCLVLTLTRSAVLSAVVIVFAFAWYATAGRHSGRRRFLIVVVVLLVAAIPVASVTKLSERTTAAANGNDVSATVHASDLRKGLDRIATNPIGQGLGTVAGIGSRFAVANRLTSENSYVQVGDEIGIIALIFFVMFLLALFVVLHRRARSPVPDADRAAAAAAILAGLIVGGFFQEIWLDFSQTLTAATIIGLASVAISKSHDVTTLSMGIVDPVANGGAEDLAKSKPRQPTLSIR